MLTESDEEGEPLEKEEGRSWIVPRMNVKAQEIIFKRNGETKKEIRIYRKEEKTFSPLDEDGDEVKTVERWVRIDSVSSNVSIETLFALAEVHGYDLEPK